MYQHKLIINDPVTKSNVLNAELWINVADKDALRLLYTRVVCGAWSAARTPNVPATIETELRLGNEFGYIVHLGAFAEAVLRVLQTANEVPFIYILDSNDVIRYVSEDGHKYFVVEISSRSTLLGLRALFMQSFESAERYFARFHASLNNEWRSIITKHHSAEKESAALIARDLLQLQVKASRATTKLKEAKHASHSQ